MKIRHSNHVLPFSPTTLSILFESADEMRAFTHIIGCWRDKDKATCTGNYKEVRELARQIDNYLALFLRS